MSITALPTPPSASDPSTFAARADALLGALPTFVTENNAQAALITLMTSASALKLSYTFSTTTTDADPGAGFLRLSNATQNLSTVIRFDGTDLSTVDMSAVVNTFDDSTSAIKGFVRLVKSGDASKWIVFSVSSLANPTGYFNLTVVPILSSAASPFTNGETLLLEFSRNGDKGDTGATGSSNLTYTARASNTALAAADFASSTRLAIVATGTFTQTIVAAAGITAGGYVPYKNGGTGVITIDPNSSETINGATTLKLYPGESCNIICDGSAFYTTGLAPSGSLLKLQATTVASSSATLDFTNVFTSEFDNYRIRCSKIKPATDAVNLLLRTSTDGGATFDSGANTYGWSSTTLGGSATGSASTTSTSIQLTTSQGNATQEWATFTIEVSKPMDASYFIFSFSGLQVDDSGNLRHFVGTGMRQAAADVDSFRLFFSSGNIASGEVEVFGIRR